MAEVVLSAYFYWYKAVRWWEWVLITLVNLAYVRLLVKFKSYRNTIQRLEGQNQPVNLEEINHYDWD